jgi:hypothetical protein
MQYGMGQPQQAYGQQTAYAVTQVSAEDGPGSQGGTARRKLSPFDLFLHPESRGCQLACRENGLVASRPRGETTQAACRGLIRGLFERLRARGVKGWRERGA